MAMKMLIKVPTFDLSFRELLELSSEEEDMLVKELFEDKSLDNQFENLPCLQQNVTSKVQNIQIVSSMQPNNQQITPKFLFQNSNITINFNITKN